MLYWINKQLSLPMRSNRILTRGAWSFLGSTSSSLKRVVGLLPSVLLGSCVEMVLQGSVFVSSHGEA